MKALHCVSQFNELSYYLKSLAYKLTRNKEESEDLFQDTALLVFRHQNKFKPGTNLKAWVSTIMRNVFINKFRKRKRSLQIQDNLGENYILDGNLNYATNNDGEGAILSGELLDIIQSIDESLRVPFWMYYKGMKYEEISKELELPLGTVKSRIFFARKALRAKIKARFEIKQYGELI